MAGRRGRDRPRGAGRPFDGRESRFEIDPEIKHRLLNGLDDIGLTLQSRRTRSTRTSASASAPGPVTTAL